MEMISQEQLLLHCQELLTNVFSIYEQNLFVDTVLHCGDQEIKAHRLVLAAFSPLLREQLRLSNISGNLGVDHVYLDDLGVGATTIKVIVDFMYLGWLNTKEESRTDLLTCAKVLNIPLAVTELERAVDLDTPEIKKEVVGEQVTASEGHGGEQGQVTACDRHVDSNGFPRQPHGEAVTFTDIVLKECENAQATTESSEPDGEAETFTDIVLKECDNAKATTESSEPDGEAETFTDIMMKECDNAKATTESSEPDGEAETFTDIVMKECDNAKEPTQSSGPVGSAVSVCVLGSKTNITTTNIDTSTASYTNSVPLGSTSGTSYTARISPIQQNVIPMAQPAVSFTRSDLLWKPTENLQLDILPNVKNPKAARIPSKQKHSTDNSGPVVAESPVISRPKRKSKTKFVEAMKARAERRERKLARRKERKHSGRLVEKSKPSDNSACTRTRSASDVAVVKSKVSNRVKRNTIKVEVKEEPLSSDESYSGKYIGAEESDDETWIPDKIEASCQSKRLSKKYGRLSDKNASDVKPLARKRVTQLCKSGNKVTSSKCETKKRRGRPRKADSLTKSKPAEEEKIPDAADLDLELIVKPDKCQLRTFEVCDGMLDSTEYKTENVQLPTEENQIVLKEPSAVLQPGVNQDKNKPPVKSLKLDIEAKCKHQVKSGSCDVCIKGMQERRRLMKSISFDSQTGLYMCGHCGFMSNRKMMRHHITSHQEVLQYLCRYCPQTFRQKNSLDVHERMHTGERPFICGFCGHAFISMSGLNSHERLHTGNRPYQCDRCACSYTTKNGLTLHLGRTHQIGKSYKCPICWKVFWDSHTYNTHKNRHTGAVQYQCPQCMVSFRCNGDLRRHYRRTHPEVLLARSASGSHKKLFEAGDNNVVVEGGVLDES